MELHQLEAFEAVIRHNGFTRAAEALHLTQPAVTRQIAALEAELRGPLFERMGRTVRLTAAGERLHAYAAQILRLSDEARFAVADVVDGGSGRLAIAASSTLATYVLPPLLRQFREAYPRVELSVHTGVSAQVVEMVLANDADLGLVTGEVHEPLLVQQPLTDYATCVVLPVGHALTGRATVSPSELSEYPLILMEPGTNLRAYVDRILSTAGVEEQVSLEMDNVEAIKRMIEAGLGISLLPQVAVAPEVESGRLAAVRFTDVPLANRRITLLHRRDKYLTATLRSFCALLRSSL